MSQRFVFSFLICCIAIATQAVCQTAPIAAVQLLQHNTLFIGVDNPIAIVAQQDQPVSLDQVSITSGTITGTNGEFVVRPDAPGGLLITVTTKKGKAEFKYFAKPVGPIVPRLGALYADGTTLSAGAFKAQVGLAAVIDCCGFDANCNIQSYMITRISLRGTAESVLNTGARYGTDAQALVQKSIPGDSYLFSRIMAQCPGDTVPRTLNTVLINIER